jgi:hypothetical protein
VRGRAPGDRSCRPRAAGGRPLAGLEFVVKVLTRSSPARTRRSGALACFASRWPSGSRRSPTARRNRARMSHRWSSASTSSGRSICSRDLVGSGPRSAATRVNPGASHVRGCGRRSTAPAGSGTCLPPTTWAATSSTGTSSPRKTQDMVSGVLHLPADALHARDTHRAGHRQFLPAPEYQAGPPGRGVGRGEQRRTCLRPDQQLLAQPDRGSVHRAALLRARRHRPPNHREQGSMIRRYIIWRNRHVEDLQLCRIGNRANVA